MTRLTEVTNSKPTPISSSSISTSEPPRTRADDCENRALPKIFSVDQAGVTNNAFLSSFFKTLNPDTKVTVNFEYPLFISNHPQDPMRDEILKTIFDAIRNNPNLTILVKKGACLDLQKFSAEDASFLLSRVKFGQYLSIYAYPGHTIPDSLYFQDFDLQIINAPLLESIPVVPYRVLELRNCPNIRELPSNLCVSESLHLENVTVSGRSPEKTNSKRLHMENVSLPGPIGDLIAIDEHFAASFIDVRCVGNKLARTVAFNSAIVRYCEELEVISDNNDSSRGPIRVSNCPNLKL